MQDALARLRAISSLCPIDQAEKEEEDFQAEWDRLLAEREAAASPVSTTTSPALSKTSSPALAVASTGAASIPRFYCSPRLSANKLPVALLSAAKGLEVQQRLLELESYWDQQVMHRLWTSLAEATTSDKSSVEYHAFRTAMVKFDLWLFDYAKKNGRPDRSELPPYVPGLFVTCPPSLGAESFLAVPRIPGTAKVPAKALYAHILKKISLFKAETELAMRDSDDDGYIAEHEMEGYVEDLVSSVPQLESVGGDFLPFYCCSVVRRLFWVCDPRATGKLKIDKLIGNVMMEDWLEVQLSPEDIPRNWFGCTISKQLHEKFLTLNESGTGMLTVAELHAYKKGIPPVVEDGLPAKVSPLSKLFIERVFDIMPTFKGEMDYKCFVDFVIAVEFLPQCPRPAFFWEVFDIHGDGVLTPMIVNLFFRSVHERLEAVGVGPPPLDAVVPEIFDMIPTREPLRATREEFCSNPQLGLVCAVMIDCLAFWTYDRREQTISQQMFQTSS